MAATKKLNLVSVEDYLNGELVSPIKHEYLGGFIYAMAGARNAHNTISGNVFAALHSRLRGNRCRPFNSDTNGITSIVPYGRVQIFVAAASGPMALTLAVGVRDIVGRAG